METPFRQLMEQAVRLMQTVGIPLCGALFGLGLLLLLVSGKNPIRKRAAFVLTIAGGFGTLAIAAVPLLSVYYKRQPAQATGNETVQSLVDSTSVVGAWLFQGLYDWAVAVIIIAVSYGVLLFARAANRPQQRRLGMGLILFAPIVLLVVTVIPKIISSL